MFLAVAASGNGENLPQEYRPISAIALIFKQRIPPY
jgi:hypothetical protein